MQRIRRFLVLTLLVCLGATLPGIVSNAEDMSGEQTSAGAGLEDENPQRLDAVTAMDEDGNIFEVDEEGGELEDPGIAAFSRDMSVKVVNIVPVRQDTPTGHTVRTLPFLGYTAVKSVSCFQVSWEKYRQKRFKWLILHPQSLSVTMQWKAEGCAIILPMI